MAAEMQKSKNENGGKRLEVYRQLAAKCSLWPPGASQGAPQQQLLQQQQLQQQQQRDPPQLQQQQQQQQLPRQAPPGSSRASSFLSKKDEALLRRLLAKHPEADPRYRSTGGPALLQPLQPLQQAISLSVAKHFAAKASKAFLEELPLLFAAHGWQPPPEHRALLQQQQQQQQQAQGHKRDG
ncbi:hypothetical protein, conserved [Eimeria necatrix]|uniref:Uncharacterized protein n=1 Tax=Eimeria necatrix TaxID=51315 RepID=U6MW54_9EIME|nr:hypothetical protein, conserved [Eimeria necatrix]CDJ66719.1 hypothetical protein, conserved [Eimeria necatrix]